MNAMDTAAMVAVKILAFIEYDAAGWFAIIEVQFWLQKLMKTETKFYNGLSALSPELVMKIQVSILTKKKYLKSCHQKLRKNQTWVFYFYFFLNK